MIIPALAVVTTIAGNSLLSNRLTSASPSNGILESKQMLRGLLERPSFLDRQFLNVEIGFPILRNVLDILLLSSFKN